MTLSIIIVSWNVVDKLRENLWSIFDSVTDFDFEVFVVDNDSHDATVEMIRNEFPQVRLIANNDNKGFAKANNQAIEASEGEYILLLNPDMLPFKDTFQRIIDWVKINDNAWVAGCHLLAEDGSTVEHVRRFPGLWDQLAIVLKMPHIFPSVLNNYLRKDFDYAKEVKVDSVRGGFFLMNTKKFPAKPKLDERYFIWFEEVDFCKQVKRMGGEVWYTPAARCVDFVGQSFGQVKRFRTQKYFRESMLKYFLKWHGVIPFIVLYAAWTPMIFLAWLADIFKIKSRAKT